MQKRKEKGGGGGGGAIKGQKHLKSIKAYIKEAVIKLLVIRLNHR
jgi:hypothetical protein